MCGATATGPLARTAVVAELLQKDRGQPTRVAFMPLVGRHLNATVREQGIVRYGREAMEVVG